MPQLLVVDSIPFARQHAISIATSLLQRNLDLKIIEARNNEEGLQAFQCYRPEMVILDISLSGAGGLALAKAIWETERKTKILFWVHTHSDGYLGEVVRAAGGAGLFGYVLKSEGDEKLRYAMMAVFLNNHQYTDPLVRASMTRPAQQSDFLTNAEMETLIDIALGLTDRAISARSKLTVRGVQNRLATLAHKILRKDHWKLRQNNELEVFNPRTRLVMEALRRGYLRLDQLQAAEAECETWLGLSQMAKPSLKTQGTQPQLASLLPEQRVSQAQLNFSVSQNTNTVVPPSRPSIHAI